MQSSRPGPIPPPGPLLAEVAVLDDVGPPRRRRFRPYNWTGLAWLTPTVLLLGVVIAWPVARTVYRGFDDWNHRFADSQAPRAVVLTVIWTVLVPLVVVVVGYLLAQASRRTRLGTVGTAVLAAPMALSMVVTGIAYRLLYDPSPGRGAATLVLDPLPGEPPLWLGPSLITFSVMSGFVWAWVGMAVLVFRAVLDGTPQQVIDAARAEGANVWSLLFTVRLPMLRRVAALLLALIAMGTARSFDLVLLMVPGSVQDDAMVLPVHIWRHLDEPGTPALGLVWLLILAVVVVLASIGTRQQWPLPIPLPNLEHVAWWPGRLDPGLSGGEGRLRRWFSLVAVGVAVAIWAFPMVLLVSTAFRSPVDATFTSWQSLPSLESFGKLFETPMAESLLRTLVLAGVVTVLVAVLGCLAAYALVWLRPPGHGGTAAVLLFAAAVVPVQIIVPGVADLLKKVGMSPTASVLVFVHIAVGLPFAILLLRQAFAAVPVELLNRIRLRTEGPGGTLRAIALGPAKPTLIAVAALEFVRVWNDLVVALMVGVPEVSPVGQVLFQESRQFTTNAGVLAAGAVVVSLVPLSIITLTWRHVVTALVSGVVRR